MGTQSPVPIEEIRRMAIGLEGQPVTTDIEKGAIERFAAAIGDPNPLWNDETKARKGRYGGIVAPPTFLRSVQVERPDLTFETPYNLLLDGGSEWEFFEPVRAGDRITAVARIVDVIERSGRKGPMLIMVAETSYTNQLGELVATRRSTLIRK